MNFHRNEHTQCQSPQTDEGGQVHRLVSADHTLPPRTQLEDDVPLVGRLPDEPEDTPWSALRRYGDRDDWMVFSTPLRAEDGLALGNLYCAPAIADELVSLGPALIDAILG